MSNFQRMTAQRRLILEAVRSTTCHPTADWVYAEVRRRLPSISLGTVYRNLRALVEMGEIMELSYGDAHDRFDGNPNPHYHFRCRQCGEVCDIPFDFQPELEKEAAQRLQEIGITVHGHRLEFFGFCPECSIAAEE